MSYKGWPRPPPVGCGIQRGIPDTAHGTANQRHSAAFFQASFCRLYRYVEFRMLSFAMNNRNSVESFCCLSCSVLKEFQRANFRRSWLLPLLLVWGHFSCMAQQPAAKPSAPRIEEKVLAELSGRGQTCGPVCEPSGRNGVDRGISEPDTSDPAEWQTDGRLL